MAHGAVQRGGEHAGGTRTHRHRVVVDAEMSGDGAARAVRQELGIAVERGHRIGQGARQARQRPVCGFVEIEPDSLRCSRSL